jgi:hypothetical protein
MLHIMLATMIVHMPLVRLVSFMTVGFVGGLFLGLLF